MRQTYSVYLLASVVRGTLYFGVTNNLVRRVAEHKSHLVEGFGSKYGVTLLVWFETHEAVEHAIRREGQTKQWKRDWKPALFRDTSPRRDDLCPSLAEQSPFG